MALHEVSAQDEEVVTVTEEDNEDELEEEEEEEDEEGDSDEEEEIDVEDLEDDLAEGLDDIESLGFIGDLKEKAKNKTDKLKDKAKETLKNKTGDLKEKVNEKLADIIGGQVLVNTDLINEASNNNGSTSSYMIIFGLIFALAAFAFFFAKKNMKK